jgi:hypothetical protein
MGHPTVCACSDDVLLCDVCRATAVDVAAAVAEICDDTRANAVNEIEYTDPFTGRVSMMRREPDGQWAIKSVRQLGSAERARCRPTASSA